MVDAIRSGRRGGLYCAARIVGGHVGSAHHYVPATFRLVQLIPSNTATVFKILMGVIKSEASTAAAGTYIIKVFQNNGLYKGKVYCEDTYLLQANKSGYIMVQRRVDW